MNLLKVLLVLAMVLVCSGVSRADGAKRNGYKSAESEPARLWTEDEVKKFIKVGQWVVYRSVTKLDGKENVSFFRQEIKALTPQGYRVKLSQSSDVKTFTQSSEKDCLWENTLGVSVPADAAMSEDVVFCGGSRLYACKTYKYSASDGSSHEVRALKNRPGYIGRVISDSKPEGKKSLELVEAWFDESDFKAPFTLDEVKAAVKKGTKWRYKIETTFATHARTEYENGGVSDVSEQGLHLSAEIEEPGSPVATGYEQDCTWEEYFASLDPRHLGEVEKATLTSEKLKIGGKEYDCDVISVVFIKNEQKYTFTSAKVWYVKGKAGKIARKEQVADSGGEKTTEVRTLLED